MEPASASDNDLPPFGFESPNSDTEKTSEFLKLVQITNYSSFFYFLSTLGLDSHNLPSSGAEWPLGEGVSFKVSRCEVTVSHTFFSRGKAIEVGKQLVLKRPKVMVDESTGKVKDEKRLVSLVLELQALAHVKLSSHENFAQLLSLGWEKLPQEEIFPSWPVLVQEFYPINLSQYQRYYHPLGISDAERDSILDGILAGLEMLHLTGLVHGDLKSENILIQRSNFKTTPKIADFGSSIICEIGQEVGSDMVWVGGTWTWCAPECPGLVQLKNVRATDIYSFGLLVWRVLNMDIDPFDELIPSHIASEDRKARIKQLKENANLIEEMCKVFQKIDQIYPLRDRWEHIAFATLQKDPQHRASAPKLRNIFLMDESRNIIFDLPSQPFQLQSMKIDTAEGIVKNIAIADIHSIRLRGEVFSGYDISLGTRTRIMQDLEEIADDTSEDSCPHCLKRTILDDDQNIHLLSIEALKNVMEDEDTRDQTSCLMLSPSYPSPAAAAFQLFIAYSDGFLGSPNKKLAFKCLMKSACFGMLNAQVQVLRFSLGSCIDLPPQLPIRTWLSKAMLNRYSWEASLSLKELNLELFDKMISLRRGELERFGRWHSWDVDSKAHGARSSQPLTEEFTNTLRLMPGDSELLTIRSKLESFSGARALVDVFYKNSVNDRAILHYVAGTRLCNVELVEILVDQLGFDIDARNSEGFSPLHFACRSGLVDNIKIILEKGASPKVESHVNQETPLHWLVSVPENAVNELVKQLVSRGADLHAISVERVPINYGSTTQVYSGTPLHWAVSQRNKSMCTALFEANVDVHAPNEQGISAIGVSIYNHFDDMVSSLINYGGLPTDWYISRWPNSLELAMVNSSNFSNIGRLGSGWESNQAKVIDMVSKPSTKWSPSMICQYLEYIQPGLCDAIKYAKFELIQIMLRNVLKLGSNADSTLCSLAALIDWSGELVTLAIENKRLDVVSELHECEADFSAAAAGGRTCLYQAICTNDESIIKLVINISPITYLTTSDALGYIPYTYAIAKGSLAAAGVIRQILDSSPQEWKIPDEFFYDADDIQSLKRFPAPTSFFGILVRRSDMNGPAPLQYIVEQHPNQIQFIMLEVFKVTALHMLCQLPILLYTEHQALNLTQSIYFLLKIFNAPEQINAQDTEGNTALQRAVDASSYGIVERLLNMGADPGIKNVNGETALAYTTENTLPLTAPYATQIIFHNAKIKIKKLLEK